MVVSKADESMDCGPEVQRMCVYRIIIFMIGANTVQVNAVRREPRWEDWEYTYVNSQGNRFGWLGNGWTKKDVAAARGNSEVDVDLTPWLQAGALDGNIDLRDYHEQWWAA